MKAQVEGQRAYLDYLKHLSDKTASVQNTGQILDFLTIALMVVVPVFLVYALFKGGHKNRLPP